MDARRRHDPPREREDAAQIELAEVEAATRIRARYLRAIENEEWDVLPGERLHPRLHPHLRGLSSASTESAWPRSTGAGVGADTAWANGCRGSTRCERAAVEADARPRLAPRATGAARRRLACWSRSLIVVGLSTAVAKALSGPATATAARRQRSQAESTVRAAAPPPSRSRALSLRPHRHRRSLGLPARRRRPSRWSTARSSIAGAEAGPFRSGSFTVSFGNGEVSMMVDGQAGEHSRDVQPGRVLDRRRGRLRELSEGERPTCT